SVIPQRQSIKQMTVRSTDAAGQFFFALSTFGNAIAQLSLFFQRCHRVGMESGRFVLLGWCCLGGVAWVVLLGYRYFVLERGALFCAVSFA
ncbi:MAG: hypothetical protein KDB23_25155, partial [Planctomycetales bacterium]|nr:hypothetical protein [Planctomycetales bacterium]